MQLYNEQHGTAISSHANNLTPIALSVVVPYQENLMGIKFGCLPDMCN